MPHAVSEPDLALAEHLFATLRQQTAGALGVTRDSYGDGEQAAHDLVAAVAADLGLERAVDPAGNQYVTLPGAQRDRPPTLVGSHLDSVPEGGNYDGAAGVVAGLAVLAGFRRDGVVPPADATVMAIRAEESAWFDVSYAGSSAALGLLGPDALEVRRSDTGRTLADHLTERGFDPGWIAGGQRWLDPAAIGRFLEVHIEQGPVLEAAGVPVGIVTGIRGCLRHRTARAFGAYGHSGALPRELRHDAVAATVELLAALDATWDRRLAAGEDLNVTVGELSTDPVLHGPSRVAGETRFVIDLRSLDDGPMFAVSDEALALAAEIGARRGVRFDLGARTHSPPARLDPAGIAELTARAEALGLATLALASGAGHDSALFASQGVRTNMVFIRNAHGSHNPDEAMDLDDFAQAAHLLAAVLVGG